MNFNKSFLVLTVSILFFINCKQTASAPLTADSEVTVAKNKSPEKIAKLETASFHIEGMTCAIGCAKTIEKELSETKGVQKATVDFDKKEAIVSFDATKQTPKTLVKLVEATGDGKTYKVSNLKTSGSQS